MQAMRDGEVEDGIGRLCKIGVQVVFIPASSLVITTEDICRKGVHTGRLLTKSGETGSPVWRAAATTPALDRDERQKEKPEK